MQIQRVNREVKISEISVGELVEIDDTVFMRVVIGKEAAKYTLTFSYLLLNLVTGKILGTDDAKGRHVDGILSIKEIV